jgi:uncharacterized membrane protein YkvA (DUF1232 family)
MNLSSWKGKVQSFKQNIYALYLATQDPRVPLLAKIIISLVVAYVLSPIDFIPDFIPIIGYLDDLLLVPIGIWLAIRLIPLTVWKACQAQAAKNSIKLSGSPVVGAIVIMLWLLIAVVVGVWISY